MQLIAIIMEVGAIFLLFLSIAGVYIGFRSGFFKRLLKTNTLSPISIILVTFSLIWLSLFIISFIISIIIPHYSLYSPYSSVSIGTYAVNNITINNILKGSFYNLLILAEISIAILALQILFISKKSNKKWQLTNSGVIIMAWIITSALLLVLFLVGSFMYSLPAISALSF